VRRSLWNQCPGVPEENLPPELIHFFLPWLGSQVLAINDRGMGRGAKIVSGTVRDSLHMVDVIFGLDGGELPEIVVSDTGSYWGAAKVSPEPAMGSWVGADSGRPGRSADARR
jgi:hypothetical protein